MINPPSLIAFDFDGVICDGLIEYFQTAWRAYRELFTSSPPESPPESLPESLPEPPPELADQFYPLRPVVETGWEMPILLRALLTDNTPASILEDWPTLAQTVLKQSQLTSAQASAAVDGVRDRWITTALDDWLALHRFYPGVLDQLQAIQASDRQLVIISTKEGRFIRQLLAQQGLNLDDKQIIGKEIKQPKYKTLRQLHQEQGHQTIWFIEDRLKALQSVAQQPDLVDVVSLFLADWGYNLERDRAIALKDSRLNLLSLAKIKKDIAYWP